MKRVKLPENRSNLVQTTARSRLRASVPQRTLALAGLKLSVTRPGSEADSVTVQSTKVYSTRVFLAGVGYSAYVASSEKDPSTKILNLRLGYSDTKSLVIPPSLSCSGKPGVLVVDRSLLGSIPGGSSAGGKTDSKGAQMESSPIKAIIIIRGTDKEGVNSFAASIRQLRPLSRYKGIGVSLEKEYFERKLISSAKKKS